MKTKYGLFVSGVMFLIIDYFCVYFCFRTGTFLGVLSGIMLISDLIARSNIVTKHASEIVAEKRRAERAKIYKTDGKVIKMGFDLSAK